ncbi:50S ribosomal protein L9 [bacterium]|nr:50S ribosomal protein L9 [candidate division CSSED10-310 bacterium]
MDVILKKQVHGLGKPGALVKVSDGYARNYLIPKKLAVEATPDNLNAIERLAKQKDVKRERQVRQRHEIAEQIGRISCTLQKQVSEENRIFGSVSHAEIIKCLKNEGIDLEKKQILLDKPIKTLGLHPVQINLGQGVEAVLKVWIEKKSD